ncbi:MAG: hypothetical protein QOK90_10690 [Nitrososphaeraceae archaeon]|nr:hypothetical protein [Nitrososphaeraceae archaeon]
MINYEYLKYWKETMETKNILEQLKETNKIKYTETQDKTYLEYILNCENEIIRLKNNAEDYYKKAFNQNIKSFEKWRHTKELIDFQTYLVRQNLDIYLKTRDTKFLEYIKINITNLQEKIKENQLYEETFSYN